jgi:hypothetical protein
MVIHDGSPITTQDCSYFPCIVVNRCPGYRSSTCRFSSQPGHGTHLNTKLCNLTTGCHEPRTGPPHVDLSSFLTQQNPSIDLRVHDYENSTRNFLKALITYKNRAITNISERRKHQAMERKNLLERTQTVEMETNQLKLKEIELVAGLDREKEERKRRRIISGCIQTSTSVSTRPMYLH